MSPPDGGSGFDYRRYAILYVDDEETALPIFRAAYGRSFEVLTAASADEGLKLLREQPASIGLLMTDQRMPVRSGTWLLEQARNEFPHIVRILATAYTDMEAAIQAVNAGGIYRYVTKPWDPRELEMTLKRGLEFFMVRKERDELLRQQLSVMRNAMIADRILGLGFLASGLSHHMRNMLVAVKTFLDLAPSKLEEEKVDAASVRDPEFWNDYYQTAQGQIDRMVELLKDLWSASEMRDARFEDRIHLRSMIEEVAATYAAGLAEKGITFRNLVPETLPTLRGDAVRLAKLFDFLMRDGLALLEAGQHIEISAEASRAADTARENVTIRVSDNGQGLSQEQLRRVFDPFAPRNGGPADLGINLMACFFIVHGHGGRIEAVSLPQGGTRYTITLPRDPTDALQKRHSTEFLPRLLLNQTSWEHYFGDDR